MACMSLLGGFMPKSTLVRMPNTRLRNQRKTSIISARRGPGVSHGGGGQINQVRKSMDAANIAKEKLTLGGFDSEKENKKKSKEKVDDGSTVNNEATG